MLSTCIELPHCFKTFILSVLGSFLGPVLLWLHNYDKRWPWNITRSNSTGLTNNITAHVALIVFLVWPNMLDPDQA